MSDVDDAKYISLTTFTRDGTPKATPVWITGRDGIHVFTTGAESWKTRRLRHDPRVELRVSDMRGRVEPHVPVHHGTAEVLTDDGSVAEAARSVEDKYGLPAKLIGLIERVRSRLGRGQDTVAVRVVLDDA